MAQSDLPDADAISATEANMMVKRVFKVAEILARQVAETCEKMTEKSHEKHKSRES